MQVILSIKPNYAMKILNWEKEYELRRSIFKRKVDRVLIYASAPISKVIGEFTIDTILCENVNKLWEKTKNWSCVDKDFFYSYFSEKEKGYAIKIASVKRYKKELCIKESFGSFPPQSFVYV